MRGLLDLIIKNNPFTFNSKHYQQLTGIAMVTSVAPNFTNIFLGVLECGALRLAENTICKPVLWNRYLDDVLLIWKGTQDQLHHLETLLSSRSPGIKYILEQSGNSVHFLDMTIFKGPRFLATGILDIKPYSKPTDPRIYLHYTSCHPRHFFRTLFWEN